LTTLFSNSDAQGSFGRALLRFDARELTFDEEPDGTRSATVDIAIVSFDANGKPDANVDKTVQIRYSKETYQEVLRRGLVYSTPVPMKKTGPYHMRAVVRDATSQKLGS